MKTSMEKISLIDRNGKSKIGRKISVTSTFESTTDKIWERLLNINTLIEICKPKATFKSCSGKIPEKWEIQKTYPFKLFIYGLIPMGRHEIVLELMDRENRKIQSREHNKIVKVWNHLIKLEPFGTGETLYTDEVEIYAGIFTCFAARWSISFYKHRQRKWQRIAKGL